MICSQNGSVHVRNSDAYMKKRHVHASVYETWISMWEKDGSIQPYRKPGVPFSFLCTTYGAAHDKHRSNSLCMRTIETTIGMPARAYTAAYVRVSRDDGQEWWIFFYLFTHVSSPYFIIVVRAVYMNLGAMRFFIYNAVWYTKVDDGIYCCAEKMLRRSKSATTRNDKWSTGSIFSCTS